MLRLIQCHKCGHEWLYKPLKKPRRYTNCSLCRTSVKTEQEERKKLVKIVTINGKKVTLYKVPQYKNGKKRYIWISGT